MISSFINANIHGKLIKSRGDEYIFVVRLVSGVYCDLWSTGASVIHKDKTKEKIGQASF